jgi:hypothetical protein
VPEPASPSPSAPANQSVTFYFEKTGSFQTLHADGAVASVTPSGHVFVAFYVERAPIPKTAVYPVDEGGIIREKPTSITGKQGVFRELQSGVIFTRQALRQLSQYITNILDQMDNADKQS